MPSGDPGGIEQGDRVMTAAVLEERQSWSQMVIAISGSNGLIGSALIRAFKARGSAVRRIVRNAPTSDADISWDTRRETIDAAKLADVDVVINLAGENLAQRWTTAVRHRIRDSRVDGTHALVRALVSLERKPRVLLSGSAIGVYGNRGDELLDESSSTGSDFLAEVCTAWEAATKPASDAGIRVALLRTGIVLSRDGGALAKMLMPFRLGVGGRLGSGRQWMSWISIDDYPRAVSYLIANDALRGPVNMVAPNPATNAEFSRTLARVLGRPSFFGVPKFALELAFGDMADDTVLASQRVIPRRLLEAGFDFQHSTLESALRAEVTRSARLVGR
jgi:uncharacterized protein (TIGR01777 family)